MRSQCLYLWFKPASLIILHTVNAFTEVADKFSTRVLGEAEKVLADRERRTEKTAGTDGWDVQMLLRQVTRV